MKFKIVQLTEAYDRQRRPYKRIGLFPLRDNQAQSESSPELPEISLTDAMQADSPFAGKVLGNIIELG